MASTKPIKTGSTSFSHKVLCWIGYLSFVAGLSVGYYTNHLVGFVVFAILFCPVHAYLIISQSAFAGKQGTNKPRQLFGRWAPLTNVISLLPMLYFLVLAVRPELKIDFGLIIDIVFLGVSAILFLSYFFIRAYNFGKPGMTLFPFTAGDSKEVFTRFETMLYSLNLLIFMGLLYAYLVQDSLGRLFRTPVAFTANASTQRVIETAIIAAVWLLVIGLLAFLVYGVVAIIRVKRAWKSKKQKQINKNDK